MTAGNIFGFFLLCNSLFFFFLSLPVEQSCDSRSKLSVLRFGEKKFGVSLALLYSSESYTPSFGIFHLREEGFDCLADFDVSSLPCDGFLPVLSM